jgi:predicted nucleotidyltransferase
MSYIVKTIRHEDNTDIKKLETILKKLVLNVNKNLIKNLLKKFEESGYVICKKIKI